MVVTNFQQIKKFEKGSIDKLLPQANQNKLFNLSIADHQFSFIDIQGSIKPFRGFIEIACKL